VQWIASITKDFATHEGSFCSRVVGRIARSVTHRVNDDLGVGHLVEDEIWIWLRRHAPNGGIIGYRTSQRIPEQQIGNRANSSLDAFGSLRGTINDVIQN
jgi:hypothetical protein